MRSFIQVAMFLAVLLSWVPAQAQQPALVYMPNFPGYQVIHAPEEEEPITSRVIALEIRRGMELRSLQSQVPWHTTHPNYGLVTNTFTQARREIQNALKKAIPPWYLELPTGQLVAAAQGLNLCYKNGTVPPFKMGYTPQRVSCTLLNKQPTLAITVAEGFIIYYSGSSTIPVTWNRLAPLPAINLCALKTSPTPLMGVGLAKRFI